MRPSGTMVRYRQRKFSRYKVVLAHFLLITTGFLTLLLPILTTKKIRQITCLKSQSKRQDLLFSFLMRLSPHASKLIKKALDTTRQDHCWPYLDFLCETEQEILKKEGLEYRLKLRKNITRVNDELAEKVDIKEIVPALHQSGIISKDVYNRPDPWKRVLKNISSHQSPRVAMEGVLAFCPLSSIADDILKTRVLEDGSKVEDGTLHLWLQLYQEKEGVKIVRRVPAHLFDAIEKSIKGCVGKKYGLGLKGRNAYSSGNFQLTLGKRTGYRPSCLRRAFLNGALASEMEREIRKKHKNWAGELFQVIIDADLDLVHGRQPCLQQTFGIAEPIHEYDEEKPTLEDFVNNSVVMDPPIYTLEEITEAIGMKYQNVFMYSAKDIRFMVGQQRGKLCREQSDHDRVLEQIIGECVMAKRSDVMEVLFQCGLFSRKSLRLALGAIRFCMDNKFEEMEVTLRRLYRLEISYTDLHKAARLGMKSIAEKSIAEDPDLIFEQAYDGSRPLDLAIDSGDLDTVKLLAPCQNQHLIFPAKNRGVNLYKNIARANDLGFCHIVNYLKSLY